MTETPKFKIPYSRPLLPDPIALLPYLHRLHRNRYYSNTGPLVLEFEQRLEALFGAPCVTASSATSALTACLIALDLPPRSLVACPSWTFVATPASIIAAGHTPYFVDVDDITNAVREITAMPLCEAAVIVSPFGAPLDTNQIQDSGFPIIIDAAAGFDAFSTLCRPGKIPVCISTHATKSFGTGEGGFVTCTDEPFLKKVRNILNFGIDTCWEMQSGALAQRTIDIAGINGKMSEYHAAVGLASLDGASLDGWRDKRVEWMGRQLRYNAQSLYAQSTMAVTLDRPAAPIAQKLRDMGIEARHDLYGCHTKRAFIACSRTDLSVTEHLMENTIYLPFSVDMPREDIDHVKSSLTQLLETENL